jgi:hypothetical protein
MLRRIGAVVGGVLTVVVLDTGLDAVMHATGVFPPPGQPMRNALFLLATTYRAIDGIVAGYIVARLAPDRPMTLALALGIVGLVLSSVGAIVAWRMGPAFGPIWYPLALVVIAMPCALAGGALATRR